MAFIQVPPDSTGKEVETVTPGVPHRQVFVLGDATSTVGLVVVTSSAGALVNISSGAITLSSAPVVQNASSGIVQALLVTSSGVNLYSTLGVNVQSTGYTVLTTGPLQVLTSGPITLGGTVTLSSAGLTQVLPVTSSGINLYTTQGLQVIVMGTSGVSSPVTSSAGLLTAVSNTVRSLSSGTVTLSSNPTVVLSSPTSLSSGTVTLSSATSLSSGTVTLSSAPVVQLASSGIVTVLQSTVAITPFTSAVGPWIATLIPISSGQMGSTATPFTYVSSSSVNSNNVKSAAGTFYGFYAFNTTAAPYYLKVHNTSSAPTVGTTAAGLGFGPNNIPLTFGIPASTGGVGGAGAQHTLPYGVYASNGIGFTITANANATDTGTVGGPNAIALTLYYI